MICTMLNVDPFSLYNKTILITGASSGIGRQTAIDCSYRGANLILLGRKKDQLERTFDQLTNGKHSFFPCDVTKFDDLEEVIQKAVETSGKICGFVHCAGIELTVPINVMKSEIYFDVYAVNVISAFEITKIISKKKYLSDKGASIVFMSSVMGLLGQGGKTAYCSSKGALISGANALAVELASKKIRVNCILPAIVLTEMTEKLLEVLPTESIEVIRRQHLLGFGDVKDVSNACIYYLSDASKWVTGSKHIIDGGYSIV